MGANLRPEGANLLETDERKSAAPASARSLGEIALAFLRLGFVAFGGPAAHIALMEEEFVRRRKWLSREDFVDRLGAVNLLPGPTSTEMAIYLGELRGGFPGLLTAGASFILPAAFLTLGLAWAYVRYGALPQMAGVLLGVKPVVVVLLAQAVWALARAAMKSRELAILAAVVLALAAMGTPTLPLLIGTGVAWIVANRFGRSAAALPATPAAGALALGAAATASGVFFYFLKIGALLVGSGYVLLAVLRQDLVERLHWLSESQLLDAIAVSQATPGPFFTVATFVGYLLAGWRGAGLGTLAMFLPAFAYVALTASVLTRMRRSPNAGAFLDGVNAAAVALMAFVSFQFAREAVRSPLAVLIAGAAALLVFRFRVSSAWVILGGALAGVAAKFAVR
jgi:chromate transporter